jgi:hypothetical protein
MNFKIVLELLEHPLISMVRAESIDEGRGGAKHPTLRGGGSMGGGVAIFLEKSDVFSNRTQENFSLSLRKKENFP